MPRPIYRAVILFLLPIATVAQPSQLMTWNLLNFTTSSIDRIPYYRIVIDSMLPDILVTQEVHGEDAAVLFGEEAVPASMRMAPFVNGYDTDNALYYDTVVFTALPSTAILTQHRDITQFVLRHRHSGDTLRIFSVHLKASQGGANVAMRASEADSLRKVTDALPTQC